MYVAYMVSFQVIRSNETIRPTIIPQLCFAVGLQLPNTQARFHDITKKLSESHWAVTIASPVLPNFAVTRVNFAMKMVSLLSGQNGIFN